MANQRVFFVSAGQMSANFQRIIKADPPMAKEAIFHDFLLRFAGTETNAQHLLLVLTLGLKTLNSGYPVNLSRYVEALVDDVETVRTARASLERIAILQKQKEGSGQLITP